MKTVIASILSVPFLLQIMSFADSERRLGVVFYSSRLFCHNENLTCCCNCSDCLINNSNDPCNSQCDTYFSVCFKENGNISEECIDTTNYKPTDDNTTRFTTPNIAQFMINSENLTFEIGSLIINLNVTNETHSHIDSYRIDVNQTTLKQALYNGSKGISQINISIVILSFSCNYYVTNCTERYEEYSHYFLNYCNNKTCRNDYINSKSDQTQKISTCKCNPSLEKTSYLLASSTPSSSVKDDDSWKVTAIVSLTLCLLFVLSWIILIIVLCCCKFKMKGDGEVDAGKFGGINNLIYAQPIISTIGAYVSSKLEYNPVDTYSTLYTPPATPNTSTTTNADYSALINDTSM